MSAEQDIPTATGRCLCCSLTCATIKILCFSCSKSLCPCCHPSPPPHKPELNVLCLGLQASGKSTLLGLLAGEPVEASPQPTMGFAIKAFLSPSASLHFKELGGSERIRPYWSKYYSGQDAIMFVVDSSCSPEALEETRTCLQSCLSDHALQELPLMVLCNKQDTDTARTPQKISEELHVQELCQGREYKVEGCSSKDVPALRQALEVLVDMTNRHKMKYRAQMGWETIKN